MANVTVPSGSIVLTTTDTLTLTDINELAAAGQLAGVPEDSIVTSISFQFGVGSGNGTFINLSWKAPVSS